MKSPRSGWPAALCASIVFAALHLAPPAHAQQPVREGNFVLSLQRDSAADGELFDTAVLLPSGSGSGGGLVWMCLGGERWALGIKLTVADSSVRRTLEWHSDQDPRLRTTRLEGPGELWLVYLDGGGDLTRQAKTATRLALRVLEEGRPVPGMEYAYDLDGAARALNRLECTRDPGPHVVVPRADLESPPAAQEEGTYELGAVDVMPRVTNRREIGRLLKASHPDSLLAPGEVGTVVLRFLVGEDGRVNPASVSVVRSTHEPLNAPAIQAARRMILTPARVRGRAVKVWLAIPIEFVSPDRAPAAPPAADTPAPPPAP